MNEIEILQAKTEKLEERIQELERRLEANKLMSRSFISRALSVFGHNIGGFFLALIPWILLMILLFDETDAGRFVQF